MTSAIIFELARRIGHEWGEPKAETIWNELRQLSPMHAGMSYRAPRGTWRHSVAVLTTKRIPAKCICTAGCGKNR